MIRKLILPLAALVLLAGCATSGYSYRSGSGDYYHGRPSVDYRYYPSHPYGYYGPYRYGSYRYANPWGYRYYRYPYGYRHVYPRYPRHIERPRTDSTPDRPRSPWRDLDRLRDRDGARHDAPATIRPRTPAPTGTPAPPRVRSGSGDSSAIGGMVRRTRDRRHKTSAP